MDDLNLVEAEAMEKEAKFQIIHIDDHMETEAKRKILDTFMIEVTVLFAEFKEWLKDNRDPEKIAIYKEKVKLETALLMQKVKIALAEFQENETVKVSKDTIVTLSKQVGDKLSSGVQEVMQHRQVQKVIKEVDDFVQQVKDDERVKTTVKKVKRGTLQVASSAYDGLKKALEESPKEDVNQKQLSNQDSDFVE